MNTQTIMEVALLACYIAVFIWQYNLINLLKSKLEILDKFQSVFDIKKLEEYIEVIEKKHKEEKVVDRYKYITSDVARSVKAEMSKIPQEMMDRYSEIALFTAVQLKHTDEGVREAILADKLVLNAHDLRLILEADYMQNL